MKRSDRLGTLVRLSAMAEQASRLRLARANQDLGRKEAQQRQLEGYDAEYAQDWIEEGRRGVAGQRLLGLAAFRAGLGRSLDAQQQAVDASAAARAAEAARWRATRERLRVFTDLAGRARAVEQRDQDRKTERALDELAARRREPD